MLKKCIDDEENILHEKPFSIFFNKFKQFDFYKLEGLIFIVPTFLLMMNRK